MNRWGKPFNSRKWHLFGPEDQRSLCFRWMFRAGGEHPAGAGSLAANADDCKDCVKRHNAALAKGGAA